MDNDKHMIIILALQQLLESMAINGNNNRTKVFSEKIAQVLESIPQFIEFLNEDNITLRNEFFVEFGRYIKYHKFQKGTTIQCVCEGDKLFHMIATGKILKLNIKYKNLYSSLKDYILYLTKLYILNEKYLYNDCIKKNQDIFPIKENIDILKYANKIKFFDFKEEIKKIKNRKAEILFDNCAEEKIKKKLSVEDILLLYNPDIEIGDKKNFLNNEMKFLVSLPYFYVEKILEPISFLGHLNKNRGIKKYCCYICLNNSDVFILDKENIKNRDNPIYNIINRKKSILVTEKLFKNNFLFKDTDINFLIKNYSKYFEIKKIKKNDYIIYQGSVYEGIFFIINGMLQLKSNRSYNELSDLNYGVLNNLDSKTKKQENLKDFDDKKKNGILNKLIHNPLFIKKSNEKKEINFGTFSNNEIIGLNDIYDKKKGISNFSVQCLTNEAELFFVPKEIFTSLITNQEILDKINSLTQEKNKLLSLKIKKYKNLFELEFDKFLSPDKEEKNNRNDFYHKLYHKSSLENKSILNRLIFKNGKKKLFENTSINNNKLIKSKSATDISKDTNIIPNNKIFIDFAKKYNNYEIGNQSRISLQNNSVINNESSNDNLLVFQSQNLNRINNLNLNLNKNESQVLSIISNNKISDNNSIQSINKNENISKTLNNFFKEKNQSIKQMNKLIKSSSTECLGQNSESGRLIKPMEDISNFYANKNKKVLNNGLIIPIIKDFKIRKMNFDINKMNYRNENNYLNEMIKKNNNLIDISPKKNCITINKENNIKAVINNDTNKIMFIKKDSNNKIKKIKFQNLI